MTKMTCYQSVVFILSFAVLGSVKGNVLISLPSLVTREGENAEIPCLTSGEGDILTWRKGHDFSSSEFVASLNGDNSQENHFDVAPNGTLYIFNVTREDNWNYYCRKASKTNDCNVGVSVLVQDQQSTIFIDQCQPHKDCVLFTDDSEHTSTLTCTALFVSHQTVLKWFNGDQLLESYYDVSSEDNSTSINISSTITASFGYQTNLQCFAFDERIGKIDGMSANVHIEKQLSNTHLIIAISILAAILFLLIVVGGIASFVYFLNGMENREEIESEESVPLTKKVSKERLLQQLDEALSRNVQLKKIAEKINPGLIIRLKDDNVKKDKDITWSAYLTSIIVRDTSGVEKDLETLPDVQCVVERGELQKNSINSTSFKELLQNSVYGWNSCIILNFEKEDKNDIALSLKNVCRSVYDIIRQAKVKGFQVENRMALRKLEKNTLQENSLIDPEPVTSFECAETFIEEKAKGDTPMALEFYINCTTDVMNVEKITGLLKVVVLHDIKELPHAIGKQGCKLVESKQCKSLIVVDGSLGDGNGKTRIKDVLKKIKSFREP